MKTERSWVRLYILFILLVVFVIFYVLEGKKKTESVVESLSYGVNVIVKQELKSEEEKEVEEIIVEEEPVVQYEQHTGDLTGYSADCPACNGTLACMPKYNVYKNGVTTFSDKEYGNVNIVATSKKVPCGSIIKYNDKYAIVLDRGVLGYDVDLLVESEAYAIQHVGRSEITYEIIRSGW